MPNATPETRSAQRLVVVAIALAAAACAAGPESGQRRETSTVSAPPTNLPAPPTVIGPSSLGRLELGMTWARAEELGEVARIDNRNDPAQCHLITTPVGSTVWFKDLRAVALIPAPGQQVWTPEGIAAGSGLDEVRAKYPALQVEPGWSSAPVPERPGTYYGLQGLTTAQRGEHPQVTRLSLFSDADTCSD